ncbi:hypothetical protein Dsin_002275 [Dipteronia sinensis]|uniref:Uncharacterized protein n=1 Tax=Dipteronia sinensis TaxID=43782 RepID=A0AAE0EJJ1_9ROSI|nr:hypothetical protein Dsin_002275 [Dipteronia sinensis]
MSKSLRKRSGQGVNTPKLANEIGIVVRNHAPLMVDNWKNLIDETKQPIVDRVNVDEAGAPPSPIILFHDMHFNDKNGWINDKARDKFEQMIALQTKSVEDGSLISDEDICEKVLGKRSGYVKGLGFGPRPKSFKYGASTQVNTNLKQKVEIEELELETQ